ncbi:MAG: hypothetical protein AABY00_00505 [Nanoarchaeota archaeon]
MSGKEVAKYIGVSILSLLLVFSLVVGFTSLSARAYLSPTIYEQVFAKHGFYEQALSSSGNSQVSFPKGVLQEQGTKVIRNLLSYINSETENLDLVITLDASTLRSSVEQKIASLPECTANQQAVQGENVVCKPAGADTSKLVTEEFQRRGITADKPYTVDLAPILDKEHNLGEVRQYVSYFRIFLIASFVFALLCLVGTYFLRDSLSSRLRWIGLPLVSASIALFLIQGILGAALSDQFAQPSSSSTEKDLSRSPLVVAVMQDLVTPLTSSIAFYSIIVGIIGLIVFGCSFFFKTTTQIPVKEKKK